MYIENACEVIVGRLPHDECEGNENLVNVCGGFFGKHIGYIVFLFRTCARMKKSTIVGNINMLRLQP